MLSFLNVAKFKVKEMQNRDIELSNTIQASSTYLVRDSGSIVFLLCYQWQTLLQCAAVAHLLLRPIQQ